MDLLAPLNALVFAIGEELSDLAGLRMTRVLTGHAPNIADTSMEVESLVGWPAVGKFVMDGQAYSYSSIVGADILNGISPPIQKAGRELQAVVDTSRTYSGADVAKNMLFVDTAEAEFLDAIGRNYGIPRPDGLSDALYRKLIQAVAFAPKGTMLALELALNAVLTPGSFTIFEDLVNHPNEIFITLNASDTSPSNKSYFDVVEQLSSASVSTVALTNHPLGDSRDSVRSVRLAPDYIEALGVVKPSAETVPWAYTGTQAEGTHAVLDNDGSIKLTDTDAAGAGAQYQRVMRARVETGMHLEAQLKVNSVGGAALSAFESKTRAAVQLDDGVRRIIVGLDGTSLYAIDAAGANLITPVAAASGAVHRVTIDKKKGLQDAAPDNTTQSVAISLDGALVATITYAALAATSGTKGATFGSLSVGGTSDVDWLDVRVSTDDGSNLWNLRNVGTGSIDELAHPSRISDTVNSPFATADVGRALIIRNGTAKHGRNNGRAQISARDSAQRVLLTGVKYGGGSAKASDRFQIDEENNFDFFTSEDAGVQAALVTGAGANGIRWLAHYGGDDGNQISVAIIAVTPHPTITITVVDAGGGDMHIEVRPIVNAGGVVLSTAAQVVAAVKAATDASALVDVSLLTNGSGLVAAVGLTALTGGENGKLLQITGSGLGNNSVRVIATLVDEHTVLLGSHITPATLVLEDGLTWQKNPNSATETGLEYEIVAGGQVLASPTITLRRNLASSPQLVEVVYTVKNSGQIEGGFAIDGKQASRRALYLIDRLAFLQGILDSLVAAGVFVRLKG